MVVFDVKRRSLALFPGFAETGSSFNGQTVCIVGVLWPNGWMDRDATWYGGRPPPRQHLDGMAGDRKVCVIFLQPAGAPADGYAFQLLELVGRISR